VRHEGFVTRVDPTVLRRGNLGVVLRHIATAGPISRARVAAETGLNKSTVSSLVAELDELGLVREGADAGRMPATVGRPATPIVITGTTVALGLEIAVDGITAGIEDLTGAVRFETRRTRMLGEDPPLKVLDDLAALARDAFARAQTDELRVVGVGVAVPGLVDVELRTLLRAPNLGWTQIAIGAEMEMRLGLPTGVVSVGNEANLAALAELWDGVARDLQSFIHITGQVGVGAGIVIDGELYRGSRGFAGELGHMTVRPDGEPCACGARGCLETVAGLEAIRARAGMDRPEGAGEYETAERLAQLAAAQDRAAITAIDEAAEALGIALASAINLLDLQALVLGGSYTPLCPWLVPRVRDVLSARVLASTWSEFDVRGSTLGVQAPVRGAAAIHLRAVLSRPWLVAETQQLSPGRPRPGSSGKPAGVRS
jgi:predicted NBD/HSP70 family sugar kinase